MKMIASRRAGLVAFALVLLVPVIGLDAESAKPTDGWISLFNGHDLDGWTVKIAGHPIGENYGDTFRVEDGVIKVGYDRYGGVFNQQFGHLYSDLPYSNYILRLQYRFTGKPMADSPVWSKYNSGVMIHSQSPMSMTVEQLWPASIEFQFLGVGARPNACIRTGNACTPGTNLEQGGKLITQHVVETGVGELSPLDQWISVEAEVHGNREVVYRVNGVETLRYQRPQLDPRDKDAQRLLAMGAPLQLNSGHIALQSESQPVWFRNIEIRILPDIP
jgi:hypothetical protein